MALNQLFRLPQQLSQQSQNWTDRLQDTLFSLTHQCRLRIQACKLNSRSFTCGSSVFRDIAPIERGLAIPGGANIRFNDLAPGGRVPMVKFPSSPPHHFQHINQTRFQHRSQTTDYDIFFHGSVTLITPDEAYDPKNGKEKVRETTCNPGDVVMMRGALHA
jgi:hypothetical protein